MMDPWTSLSRSAALVRYHRPSQFAWRLYRTVQRRLQRWLPERFVFTAGQQSAAWKPGAREAAGQIAAHRLGLWKERSRNATEMAEGRFRFLQQTIDLAQTGPDATRVIDWNPDAPRLWRFQLQCHESLLEIADQCGADAAYQLVDSWLDQPRHRFPTRDPDAWHPFCISRRLPVWLSLASQFDPPERLRRRFWGSIADQAAWLRAHCEWDLGGNHLLENLTSLYLSDAFLTFDQGREKPLQSELRVQWDEKQLGLQLDLQLLASGEHVERTPTYHALMMVCLRQCVHAAAFCQSPAEKWLSE